MVDARNWGKQGKTLLPEGMITSIQADGQKHTSTEIIIIFN